MPSGTEATRLDAALPHAGRGGCTVVPGRLAPLSDIPGHCDVEGIARLALLDSGAIPGESFHIAVHMVTDAVDASGFRYTEPHSHEFTEVNVLLSESSTLVYRYEVDGEVFEVESPATVLLPAGRAHRMEAIGGAGIFLCIHMNQAAAR